MDFEDGKYFKEVTYGTLFKRYKDDIWNSVDGINWVRTRDHWNLGYLMDERFEEVEIKTTVKEKK